MKKKIMLVVALAMSVIILTPMTSKAADNEKTGTWKTNGNGWWYEFEDGTYYTNGFCDIDDATYYFDGNGYMATGWKMISNDWYYFQPSGVMTKGWAAVSGAWYYFGEDGVMYEDGAYNIDEDMYLFDNNGVWRGTPGWNSIVYSRYGEVKTEWCYCDENGHLLAEWQVINGKWYYFDPYYNCYMCHDEKREIDGDMYLFGTDGMWIDYTGWCYAGDWYYLNEEKECVTGWQLIDGKWYYFHFNEDEDFHGNDGYMYYGTWYDIEEESGQKRYYFEYSGAMVTGWYNYGSVLDNYGDWVYCYSDGTPAEGWVQSGGSWYYFEEGSMCRDTWIYEEDGTRNYYVATNGTLVKGWFSSGYSAPGYNSQWWIYTDLVTGKAYNGWVQSGANWYYISDGYMERGGTSHTVEEPEEPNWYDFVGEDNIMSDEESKSYNRAMEKYNKLYAEYQKSMYVFGDDGVMVTGGWYAYRDSEYTEWYYANSDGTAAVGWKEISGKWYYFDTYNGCMVTNCYIDGCWVGVDGVRTR